jgi:hypothetical protein
VVLWRITGPAGPGEGLSAREALREERERARAEQAVRDRARDEALEARARRASADDAEAAADDAWARRD